MEVLDPLGLPTKMYVIVFAIAIAGGLVGYLNEAKKPSIGEALTVVLTSAFLGFIAFLLCLAREWSIHWTLITVGIVGMMGKRAAVDLTNIVRLRLGAPPITAAETEEAKQ